jgi:uncharacterized protein YoxC
MSALAKVFVVFVFLLSVVFFGASATLYKTRTDWKTSYLDYQKHSTDELKRLQLDIGKKTDEVDKLTKSLAGLKSDNDKLSTDKKQLMEDLKTEKGKVELAGKQVENANILSESLTKSPDSETDLKKKVDDAHEQTKTALETALKGAHDATEARDTMRLDLAKSQEDLHVSRAEVQKLTNDYDTLEINYQALLKRLGPGDAPDATPAPPIDAIVNAVSNQEKLVLISAGKDQKVQPGFVFTVFRGDSFIGKVKVIKVYPDLAGASILFTKDGEAIQRGDKASTAIGGL